MLAFCGSALAQPDSLWSSTFGGPGQDSLWDVIRTADGGWGLVGYVTARDQRAMDLVQVKLDADFNVVMHHEVDFSGANDEGHGIAETPDGGFLVAGYTSAAPGSNRRAAVIIRTDVEGAEQWIHVMDDVEYSTAYSAVVRPNGDLAIGGALYPGNDWQDDFAIWTGLANGDQGWNNHYGVANRGEWGLSLINTADGGLLLAGQAMEFGDEGVDSAFAMVVKTNADGAEQWRRCYGDPNSISWAMQVIPTRDGGYAFLGATGGSDPDSGVTDWDVWLVNINAQGETLWSRRYDMGHDEWGMGITQLADGGFVMVGAVGENDEMVMNNCDCGLMRVDDEGNEIWHTSFRGANHDFGMRVFSTADGGYLIGGTTSSIGAGECDLWLLKTGADPVSVPSESPTHSSLFTLHSAFPNPFNSSTTISYNLARPGFVRLGVYDLDGRLVGTVKEGYAGAGKYSEVWNGEGVGSGTYFLNLEAGGETMVKPVMLVR